MCFYILSPAARAVNWWQGKPAWSAALLEEEEAAASALSPPDPATADARAAAVARLLRSHGDGSLSAATAVNPEFRWFVPEFDAPETGIDGALAYCTAAGYGRRVSMVVGDPACAPADWGALAAAFVAAHPDAQFWHASAAFAAELDRMGGFFVNDFGAETVIDLRVRRGGRGGAHWPPLRARAPAALAPCAHTLSIHPHPFRLPPDFRLRRPRQEAKGRHQGRPDPVGRAGAEQWRPDPGRPGGAGGADR